MKEYLKTVGWPLANSLGVSNLIYRQRNKWRLQCWQSLPYMFIHIPKNAGTSICHTLGRPDPGHFSIEQMSRSGILRNKEVIFCVLRDPVERVVSIYNYCLYMHKKNGANPLSWVANFATLDLFVSEGLNQFLIKKSYFLWPQASYVSYGRDSRIQYLSFSNIDDGFSRLSKFIGADSSLPVKNRREKRDVYISKENTTKIMNLYRDDYQLLDRVTFV